MNAQTAHRPIPAPTQQPHLAAVPDWTHAPTDIPDGFERVINEDGTYALRPIHTAPAAPAPAPQAQPAQAPAHKDVWTPRIAVSGASLTAVTVATGHYAHELGEIGRAIEMGGMGLAAAALGTAGAIAIAKATLSGGRTKQPNVNVTVNTTVTAQSSSRAASGKRSRA